MAHAVAANVPRATSPYAARKGGILLATHGGPSASAALRFGHLLADRWRYPLAVLAVAEPHNAAATSAGSAPNAREETRTRILRDRVRAAIHDALGDETDVPIRIAGGRIGPTVAAVAREVGAALIVVGTGATSPRARAAGHRVPREILRWADRPVLLVVPSQPASLRRVVLTADFGGTSVQADEMALAVMDPDAWVELVHVAPEPHALHEASETWQPIYTLAAQALIDTTRNLLPQRGRPPISTRILAGRAAPTLIELVRHEHADLIALGRHAPTGHGGRSLGDVVEAVVRSAPCSALVAPPPASLPIALETT